MSGGCFGCDGANPAGLGIRFYREAAGGRLAASCVPTHLHRGLGRLVNGGLITTFAEELAAVAAAEHSNDGLVVARVEVKYERPACIGVEMKGIVTATTQDEKAVDVAVDVFSGGQRVARLAATFVLIPEARLRELAGIGLDAAPACLVAARGPLPIQG